MSPTAPKPPTRYTVTVKDNASAKTFTVEYDRAWFEVERTGGPKRIGSNWNPEPSLDEPTPQQRMQIRLWNGCEHWEDFKTEFEVQDRDRKIEQFHDK